MNKLLNIVKNKDVFWNMMGVSFNAFYSLIIVIIVTRLNGVAAAGQFSFAFYVSSIAQTIGNYGGRIYQISDVTGKYTDGDYVLLKYVTSTIMMAVIFIFCLANGYDIVKIGLIMILVLFRFFESVSESYYGIMQKNNDLSRVGKSMTFRVILSMIIFVIVDVIVGNIVWASMGFVAGYLLFMLFYDRRIAGSFVTISLKFTSRIGRILKECFPVFLYTFLYLLILNITRYFVDLRLSDEAQGYYSILVMPASIIALFAQFMIQPMATKLVDFYYSNLHKFMKTVSGMIAGLMVFGIFAALITYMIGAPILSFVYGIDFTNYKIGLAMIVFSGICSGITSIISNILVIMRKMKYQIICYFISVFVTITISAVFVRTSVNEGLLAYILSMVIQMFLFLAIYFVTVEKKKRKGIEE